MATEITSKSYSSHNQVPVRSMDDDAFRQHMQDIYRRIEGRAYDLFDRRGHQDGHDLEDWLRAESELLYPAPVDVQETDDKLTVHAEMPGFREKDVEVRVKPHCLVIAGYKQQLGDQTKGRTGYSERKSEELFRIVDLPTEIDPSKVTTMLEAGILEIELPKVRSARPVPVASRAA